MTFFSVPASATPETNNNPILQRWDTPYQTPPFSSISNKHYRPAFQEALKIAEANIDAIADQNEEPTFDNTIKAMEEADEMLERVSSLLFNLNECNTNPELQKLVLELSPLLTRYSNKVYMNENLFCRVKNIYQTRDDIHFDGEQRQLIEKIYLRFIRNGVNLDNDTKKVFADNAEQLAELSERFEQNVLADNNDYIMHITDSSDLSGLPDNVVAAAREEAAARNLDGWVFTTSAPSYTPFMTYADNRNLREQLWRAYNTRGNRGNKNDNNEIIRRIVDLRRQQAQLLCYERYADYSLANTMAQTTDTVTAFIDDMLTSCRKAADGDIDSVAAYAKELGADYTLQSWDFTYFSERLKKALFNVDAELLRPYFQMEKVRQGIFDLYGRLYGLTFIENKSIDVYHPDVHAYQVMDGERFMGILYLDMYPRDNKRSGAWMTEFRCQSNIDGRQVRPLIQVVCNFSKPTSDKPSLLSFREVETFMHEFGHAMHGMLSDVTYPSLSCTNVRRDFVEMPSQVMENWCYEQDFLNTFAKHYATGETIPHEYIERIRNSETFMAGYLCLRQLNFGIIDMAYHTMTKPLQGRIDQFEHSRMVATLPFIDGTCTSTSFTHIFSGGYAAGYYGYKWAEVLDADIFSKFKQNGIFDKATATAFRKEILSRGGSEHPSVLFRNFMGRDPDNKALLRRCGFIK